MKARLLLFNRTPLATDSEDISKLLNENSRYITPNPPAFITLTRDEAMCVLVVKFHMPVNSRKSNKS